MFHWSLWIIDRQSSRSLCRADAALQSVHGRHDNPRRAQPILGESEHWLVPCFAPGCSTPRSYERGRHAGGDAFLEPSAFLSPGGLVELVSAKAACGCCAVVHSVAGHSGPGKNSSGPKAQLVANVRRLEVRPDCASPRWLVTREFVINRQKYAFGDGQGLPDGRSRGPSSSWLGSSSGLMAGPVGRPVRRHRAEAD